jgi:ATP-binding cassette subfamily C (CFTR/MRP) protein 1
MMHAYRENERNLKALQRLLKLDDIKQEEDYVEKKGEVKVKESWPENGEIEFKDVKMRYRPETDIVLNGLSFKVQPGQKVGIVGRTGAGKSTMALILSRICEVEEGSINIDGVDTASVDLTKLRSKITVIP